MFNVLRQVGNPVFLTGLSNAQTFNTGSLLRSSYFLSAHLSLETYTDYMERSYRNSYEKTCPFDLAHMGYATGLVCVKAPNDLPTWSDDAYISIVAS